MNYKLIEYIQRRNPNVPAIPFKIFPPQKQDLKEATTYWELVRQHERIPDLYTGEDIFQIGMDDRGHDAFITSMKNTIESLYQIANNQGYAIWSYQEHKKHGEADWGNIKRWER